MLEKERVIPDDEAVKKVEAEHGSKSPAEKYTLAQTDTLLRITGAESIEALEGSAIAGEVDRLINDHRRKMRGF